MDLSINILEAIPSHKEGALEISEIAKNVSLSAKVDFELAIVAVNTVIPILEAFDLIDRTDHKIRIGSQIRNYFRKSVIWYLKNKQKIVSNWERSGTAKELTISNLLDQAPYLLKIMEMRRFELMNTANQEYDASRIQPCSIVIIKTGLSGKPLFLHQWDQKAERFQLIGGKCREGESALETAKREFSEEIGNHDLILDKDYEIKKCFDECIEEYEVSRTYGALTKYKINVFQAFIFEKKLTLSEGDKWITLEEMLNLKTKSGRHISPIGITLSNKSPGFFERLPMSTSLSMTKKEIAPYIEAKPGIFGFKFDIQKYFETRENNKKHNK